MPTPGELVRTCPYCSASPAPFVSATGLFVSTGAAGDQRRWQAGACPACGGVTIFELDPQTGNVIAMRPEAIREWDVAHLPATVSSIWSEGVTVYRVGAYRSAVVACGRTLEQAAEERSVQGNTLQQRIAKMQTEGLITAEFKDAMDYVRLIRNVGAHAGQDVSAESAEGTMRFTQQTLRLLFEVPAELGRLTEHPPELDQAEDS